MVNSTLDTLVKITIIIVSIFVFLGLIKFGIFDKETFAFIIGVLALIGLANVVEDLVDFYKFVVSKIEGK